jgi:hypothetical protein
MRWSPPYKDVAVSPQWEEHPAFKAAGRQRDSKHLCVCVCVFVRLCVCARARVCARAQVKPPVVCQINPFINPKLFQKPQSAGTVTLLVAIHLCFRHSRRWGIQQWSWSISIILRIFLRPLRISLVREPLSENHFLAEHTLFVSPLLLRCPFLFFFFLCDASPPLQPSF